MENREIYRKLDKILPSSRVGKSKYCLGVMSYNYSETLASPLSSCPETTLSGNCFPLFSAAVCSHKPGPHVGQLLKYSDCFAVPTLLHVEGSHRREVSFNLNLLIGIIFNILGKIS